MEHHAGFGEEEEFELASWLRSLSLSPDYIEDTENKLREQDFLKKEDIVKLERDLLIFLQINPSHITPILDGIASLKKTKNDVGRWTTEEVVKWVVELGVDTTTTEKFVEGIERMKISGLGLLQISQTDLMETFKLTKLLPTLKISESLRSLKQSHTASMSSISRSLDVEREHQLVSVGFSEPFHIQVNAHNINALLESPHTRKDSFSPVICFAGPTGAGKSRLVNSFLSFEDRIHQRGPVVAQAGQVESTTGNIQLFAGEVEGTRVNLLDVEGHSGRAPQALKAEFDAFWKTIVHRLKNGFKMVLGGTAFYSSEEIENHKKKMLKMRTNYVSETFSQLTYLVSNVIVFVDRQPVTNTGYITRVSEFAKLCDKNVSQTGLPHLILIQNFCTDNPVEVSYDIAKTTNVFLEKMVETGDNLLNTFKSVSFVKLPDFNSYSSVYEAQLKEIKKLIHGLIKPQSHWMLDKDNLFSDWLWVKVFQEVCYRIPKLSEGESINVSEVFFHVCAPGDSELCRIHNYFELIYDTVRPVKFRKPFMHFEKLLVYRQTRKDFFVACRLDTLRRFADVCSSSWRNIFISEDAVNKSDSIIGKHVEKFKKYVDARAPCDYYFQPGICICEKQVHKQGHKLAYTVIGQCWKYFDSTGNLVEKAQGEVRPHEFEEPQSDEELVALFKLEVIKLLKADPITRHHMRLQLLTSSLRGNTLQNVKIKTSLCLVCLEHPADVPLSCGHYFCRQCMEIHENCKLEKCPLCQAVAKPFFMQSLPAYCRPRILGLDGGGVRGIVLVMILSQLSKYAGLPIYKLFDMIGGTSTGAILALALGAKNPPLDLEQLWQVYAELPSLIFKTNSLNNIMGSMLYNILFGPPYSLVELQRTLEQKLGSDRLIDTHANSESTKVVIVADNEGEGGVPYLFGNFHLSTGEIDFLGKLWEAATASAAAPTYFPYFEYCEHRLTDGGLVANNPTMITITKAMQLWGERPSIVVSVGTGLDYSMSDVQNSPFYWAKAAVRQSTNSHKIHGDVYHFCTSDKRIVPYSRLDIPPSDVGLNDTSPTSFAKLVTSTNDYVKSTPGMEAVLLTAHQLVAQLFYIADFSEEQPATKASAIKENVILIKTRVPLHFIDLHNGKFYWLNEDKTTMAGAFTVKLDYKGNNVAFRLLSYQTTQNEDFYKVTYTAPANLKVFVCHVQVLFFDSKEAFHISGSPLVVSVDK